MIITAVKHRLTPKRTSRLLISFAACGLASLLSTSAHAADVIGSATAPSAVSAAPTGNTPLTASPLAAAKTIQLTETIKQVRDNATVPVAQVHVAIMRPNKISIDIKELNLPDNGKLRDEIRYVSDGKYAYYYQASLNNFLKVPLANSASLVQGTQSDQAYTCAYLHLILPDKTSYASDLQASAPTTGILNGKSVNVRQYKSAASDPHATTYDVQWDQQSGLPLRVDEVETDSSAGAPTETVNQTDIDDIVLDQPIDSSDFKFNQPKSATTWTDDREALNSVGNSAPDFSVITPDGKTVKLSDFNGRPVLVCFTTSAYGSKPPALDYLQEIYNNVQPKKLAILAIFTGETQDAFQKWTAANVGINYSVPLAFDPTWQDGTFDIKKSYKFGTYPTFFLITPDGKITNVFDGDNGRNDHRVQDALKKIGITVKGASEGEA